ncbi:uncharacterized protein EV154DRAFT_482099 [Mucor mucedo]|uniref:uncharacterized protein n=1 Tax=Mucor mucedo TaxID=29922 RepID=UPI002220B90E|nr:uncharacterized protein EV154DRAFT_482099 [Mucor mucedo]KAI7890507.1 hypothetical protein EV154DRAFT_482099 [Mucor mucedo]
MQHSLESWPYDHEKHVHHCSFNLERRWTTQCLYNTKRHLKCGCHALAGEGIKIPTGYSTYGLSGTFDWGRYEFNATHVRRFRSCERCAALQFKKDAVYYYYANVLVTYLAIGRWPIHVLIYKCEISLSALDKL